MQTKITVRETGPVPRLLKSAYNRASKQAWYDAGIYFHETLWARRFTPAHGREAGYRPRSGDELPFGSKEFWRSYVGRKLRFKHHRNPFEWSGTTKRLARSVSIVSTRNRASLRYAGLRVLNFLPPEFNEELRRVLPSEARQIGRAYGGSLTRNLAAAKNLLNDVG